MSDVEELTRAASAGGRHSGHSLLHRAPEPEVTLRSSIGSTWAVMAVPVQCMARPTCQQCRYITCNASQR
jgi:hypothetical protein